MTETNDFFAYLDAEIAAHIKRAGGGDPWALYLTRALWPYPSGAERQVMLKRIKLHCAEQGRALNESFEQTVQRTFNNHNSDRRGEPPKRPLFHCDRRLGSGLWALHHDNAKKWMVENKLQLD